MEILRRVTGIFDFDPRKRKPIEKTLAPEAGAEDVCRAVIVALGLDVNRLQNKVLYMNGMRAGLDNEAGIFFIDEPKDLNRQVGVKSNGVHVEMYEIPPQEIPGDTFHSKQIPITFEQLAHFQKVAEWLKSPRFDIRKFPLPNT